MEKFIHILNTIPGVGYGSLLKLWNYFRNWEYAWQKGIKHEYIQAGLSEQFAEKIILLRHQRNPDEEYQKLARQKIIFIAQNSAEYPVLLKEIPNPPFALYRQGKALTELQNLIAIVGTRLPSAYGEKMVSKISEAIAGGGGTIVSGMAFGIDALAHRAAIRLKKSTVAVIASGLGQITPGSHIELAQTIVNTEGTLLSEYAIETSAYKHNFLERNRIISGISKAVIIIEAKEKSGALITARHAWAQNRDIYALAGDITRPQSEGCLNLIGYNYAIPIISLQKLLKELDFNQYNEKNSVITSEERKILVLLQENALSAEDILFKTMISPSRLGIILTGLEMKNFIHKNKYGEWESSL